MKDNIITKLSDRDHVLKRQSMYLGSIKPIKHEDIFLEDDKFVYREYESVDGLLKIINEIIDNSIDEAIRTNFQFSNKIRIEISDDTVIVEDNGRGIPVIKNTETDEWMPVLAFTHAKAGSNFDDTDRNTVGMNGIGSFVCNCFSKMFKAVTCDGTNQLQLLCKNNMETIKHAVTPYDKSRGTIVTFQPDLIRFGMEKIDDLHRNLIHQRLIHLATCYPNIQFKFNGKVIRLRSTRDYLNAFSEHYVYHESPNYIIAIMPNEFDDFRQTSFVNGLDIKNGGNHVDYICSEIINRLREKISRKYKTVKPGDIKNKLRIITIFRGFKNAQFDSQTKERLTNSYSEIKEFLCIDENEWDKISNKILKSEQIYDPIIETFKIKEELKQRQALNEINKDSKKKKIRCEKYLPPVGENKYLVLAEGDSACSGIMSVLGRNSIGYFAMRGVPLNSYEVNASTLNSNEELRNIIQILSLQLGKADQHEEEGNIWYNIKMKDSVITINENDEIFKDNKWISVKDLDKKYLVETTKPKQKLIYSMYPNIRRKTSMSFDNIVLAQDADCIEPESLVRMHDNSYKMIKDMVHGDQVISHIGKVRNVTNVIKTEKQKVVKLTIHDKEYIFSDRHKLIVYREDLDAVDTCLAKDVTIKDKVIFKTIHVNNFPFDHDHFVFTHIDNIEHIDLEQPMELYDIEVEEDHTFFIKHDENYDMLMHNCDGFHIGGLLIGFFQKYAPNLIKESRLKRLRTPIVTLKKNGKIVKFFFELNEYKQFEKEHGIKNYECNYLKGLGSWKKEDLKALIDEYGFDYFVQTLTPDDKYDSYIHNWLSTGTSDCRKEYIKTSQFNYDTV